MNKKSRDELKKQYEAICTVYLRMFSDITGCEFSGWLGGRYGEVATKFSGRLMPYNGYAMKRRT